MTPGDQHGADADVTPTDQSPRDPDALRRRAGVRGNPDADQHFLVDDRVLDRLPAYAAEADSVTDDNLGHVLEIGAGNGALTDRVLRAAEHVTAIERDPDLATFLREEFSEAIDADRLTIVAGDALEVELPAYDRSVANLPYGVSSEIAFRLLPRSRPTVLMFQREFAERMAADPGTDEYGRLSVTAGHYAAVEVLEIVPQTAFDPKPRVESAIVRTTPRTPSYEVPDENLFMDFLRAVFTQRRKTMRNAIRNTGHISGLQNPDAVVDAADESVMSQRAGELSPETFARLTTLAAEVGEPANE